MIETRMSIVKNAGKILTNFLQDILIAVSVLFRSAITEINNANPVVMYK